MRTIFFVSVLGIQPDPMHNAFILLSFKKKSESLNFLNDFTIIEGFNNLKVSEYLSQKVVSLPMHPYLNASEQELIVDSIKGLL